MSEWQVGDLAMVTTRDGSEYAAIYTLAPGIDYFWAAIGDRPGSAMVNPDVSARRLVVIDPEDREQVERLCDLMWARGLLGSGVGSRYVPAVEIAETQAALREFAQPTPRIEEPTSRYAVVEDRGGDEWCHIGAGVWRSLTSTGQFMVEKHWHDAGTPLAGNVVRVLSEGVTE